MSVRLLPLARAVRWTRLARQQLFADVGSAALPLVLFAASFNFNKVLQGTQAPLWPRANGMRDVCLMAPGFDVQMMLVDVHTGVVKACMSNKRTTMDAVPPLGPDSESSLPANACCTAALLAPCTCAGYVIDTSTGRQTSLPAMPQVQTMASCGGLRSLPGGWQQVSTRLRPSLTPVCHAPPHSASSTWRAQTRLKRCALVHGAHRSAWQRPVLA